MQSKAKHPILLLLSSVLLFAALLPMYGQEAPVSLRTRGSALQLVLGDEPFIILGGELANSSASSAQYMRERDTWRTLRENGLNTVLAPVYWELIEREEGKYDFSSVDSLLAGARGEDLHLVLLWFGTWKNSMSCYVPHWMKKRFSSDYILARDAEGTPQEILSALDNKALDSDRKAFSALMDHLREVDGEKGTVLMVQVENEIGMIPSAREHGKAADRLWRKSGGKDDDPYAEERFQASLYAKYAEEVARAGKERYDIPMYVNAALDSRGRRPGQYPSGGPLPHLFDIWKAEAPSIDILSPDIYDPPFKAWVSKYSTPTNPLFIPEIRQCPENAARVFYVLGKYSAIGFSPFSIDNSPEDTAPSYRLLSSFLPLIARKQSEGKAHGVLVDKEAPSDTLTIGDVKFICSHDGTISWSPCHSDPSKWGEGAFLVLEMDEKDTFLFLGTGCVATMTPSDGKGRVGILSIDEVRDSSLRPLRTLNGDEDHQGRHLRIPYGEVGAQLLRIYRY